MLPSPNLWFSVRWTLLGISTLLLLIAPTQYHGDVDKADCTQWHQNEGSNEACWEGRRQCLRTLPWKVKSISLRSQQKVWMHKATHTFIFKTFKLRITSELGVCLLLKGQHYKNIRRFWIIFSQSHGRSRPLAFWRKINCQRTRGTKDRVEIDLMLKLLKNILADA